MQREAFLAGLRERYAGRLVVEAGELAPFLIDWRKQWRGEAWAAALPATAQEAAAIVAFCAEQRVAIVPQGGNTGLSGGSVPERAGASLVLSTRRLNRICDTDPLNNTMTLEAGCVLAAAQAGAESAGRLFPLSLAAEGSCTIGGNLATNAGGTGVLRYGNARELCLGLEVVTAQGEIWSGLRGLRKDNAGYDLRDIFIGSEGTLGLITAATVKLYPRPTGRATALVAAQTPAALMALFALTRDRLDAWLTAFEIFSARCLELVLEHFRDCRAPFAQAHPWCALVELAGACDEGEAQERLTAVLARALEQGLAVDAALASSVAQAQGFWRLRESISEAQGLHGPCIKHDIALPISALAGFLEEISAAVEQTWPQARLVAFGHAGDGNLHFNVSPAPGVEAPAFHSLQQDINTFVHDAVAARGGSISAEHGLGVLRRDEAARYASAVELRLMRAVKRAFDPLNIMNPGKVLASEA